VADVAFGGLWSDDQGLGDLAVGQPASDQIRHLALTAGQRRDSERVLQIAGDVNQ
jgi:hypothetical protein